MILVLPRPGCMFSKTSSRVNFDTFGPRFVHVLITLVTLVKLHAAETSPWGDHCGRSMEIWYFWSPFTVFTVLAFWNGSHRMHLQVRVETRRCVSSYCSSHRFSTPVGQNFAALRRRKNGSRLWGVQIRVLNLGCENLAGLEIPIPVLVKLCDSWSGPMTNCRNAVTAFRSIDPSPSTAFRIPGVGAFTDRENKRKTTRRSVCSSIVFN